MDKRKLNKVMRDVKKILVLAKSAHEHLESNKISKARRELRRVINYDVDEISRLHDEDEGMAHQLLVECGIILKDAKTALRDLEFSELFDKAKELVDKIVKLEGHEFMVLEDEEHELNEIYKDSVIGHTAVIAGIAENIYTKQRFYLIASGSLPVTNFRISRAENHWQGESGWLSMKGYLHRSKRNSVEFYRVSDGFEELFVE